MLKHLVDRTNPWHCILKAATIKKKQKKEFALLMLVVVKKIEKKHRALELFGRLRSYRQSLEFDS